MGYYANEHQIEAVVRNFENCTTGKEAFTHQLHLTVAVWYLRESNEQQALDKMRTGLLRFLHHHGVAAGKYKEDLTVAWLKLIKATIDAMDSDLGLLEVTNIVLNRLSNSNLIGDSSKASV